MWENTVQRTMYRFSLTTRYYNKKEEYEVEEVQNYIK